MIKDVSVLVVDDDQGTCKILANTLAEDGYSVTTASTGEDAVEKAAKQTFDMVITDLKLPGIDGIEVIKKLKEGNIDICAIMMTAYASVDTAIKALEEGAYDYITKPFDMEELKFIVTRGVEKMNEAAEGSVDEFKLSVLDVLTKVYTRKYFYRVLSREINRAKRYNQPLSLLMVEIDTFSEYVKKNSPDAGDEALKEIAQLLSKMTRKVDFVFRYGEAEFSLLLPETNKEGACIVSKRLRDVVDQAKFTSSQTKKEGSLSLDIGLSTFSVDSQTQDDFLARAKESLAKAKQLGRGKICTFNDTKIEEVN
ncbi:MAG: diguanylate cyclase [bacterium]